ncbi:MAG: hypothetical protein HEQ32_03670 [Vampirovibrio sp.]
MNPISGYSPSPQMNSHRSGSLTVDGEKLIYEQIDKLPAQTKIFDTAWSLFNRAGVHPQDGFNILQHAGLNSKGHDIHITTEGANASVTFFQGEKTVASMPVSTVGAHITNHYKGAVGPESLFTPLKLAQNGTVVG